MVRTKNQNARGKQQGRGGFAGIVVVFCSRCDKETLSGMMDLPLAESFDTLCLNA